MYCICINCKYLKECAAYHKVESKHDERHLNEYPSFYPDHPIVNILLLNNSNKQTQIEWDVVDCLSFIEMPGYWINFY